ncbi:Solute carrier family 22 member 7 [Dissostichus eleginoides]|uniref:Solute carrier family 22 member 7 n=1 Tax=Dissostichus eleginoides TaxID=100907 RepID=A0AAD9CRP6_DISEL|nr:Solute carrier family 22 member 7 [Dissostichus eleginoides]
MGLRQLHLHLHPGTEWDLVCDRKSLTQTTSSIFFFGVMIGSIAFGFLSDRYGRRNTLLASYIMAAVFGFSSAFANSYVLFAVLRFFTGFGLTGIGVNSIVLSIEWVDTDHRSFIGVIGSLSWCLGNMLLAAFAYLVNDWRNLTMTATAPLGLAILTWWWIPESARWLLAHGKVEKAKFYLDKCAEFNKRGDLSSKINLETLSSIENEGNKDKNYTYLDLIKTPKMRKLTLLTGIVWYGIASTYYGISLNITGLGLNIYLTHFIYAAIEVPAKLMIYCCLNIVGRRKCQAGTLLLTGLCIAINIFLPQDLWHLRVIVGILGKGLSEAAFTTVYLYTTELYPTVAKRPGLLQRHESSGGLSGSSDSDAGGRLDSSSSDHHLLRGLRVRPGGAAAARDPEGEAAGDHPGRGAEDSVGGIVHRVLDAAPR